MVFSTPKSATGTLRPAKRAFGGVQTLDCPLTTQLDMRFQASSFSFPALIAFSQTTYSYAEQLNILFAWHKS